MSRSAKFEMITRCDADGCPLAIVNMDDPDPWELASTFAAAYGWSTHVPEGAASNQRQDFCPEHREIGEGGK